MPTPAQEQRLLDRITAADDAYTKAVRRADEAQATLATRCAEASVAGVPQTRIGTVITNQQSGERGISKGRVQQILRMPAAARVIEATR